ncbi:ankyrin repeat domain-containing protein 26-like [Lemur catta]|uniref:ankyrin repeat domain-containing protein 26-like n=1 Tax=Lemur catta TaxID=9447 RepID=UPI001E269C16|nr:ankyrin repeat domain-containing protein 26-like [Lemur catta]
MKTGTFFYEESPSVGTVHNGLGLHRELSSRENSMFFSSFPWTSDANLETYLTEMTHKLEQNISMELQEGLAELESGCSSLENLLL